MNEAETRAELIDPALTAAGWGVVEGSRVLRERNCQISQGRLLGAGLRAKPEIADYILVHRNRKLAVIEAKKRSLPVTQGVAQAKQYAGKLQTRFAFSTNGEGIYRIDMQTGDEGDVATFPTPDELWAATFAEENSWRDRFAAIPFEDKGGAWQPRYYQDLAIQHALDAIADGKTRILLTLATGTGKTAIAFQIAWKLFHSKWNTGGEPTRRPRILFLADRNILADQAFNAFSAFDDDALVRIAPDEIRKKGQVPKNGSVFFTIFQTFMASTGSATATPSTGSATATPSTGSGAGSGNKPFEYRCSRFLELTEIRTSQAYCYLLECSDGSLYTGSTKNLKRRLQEHQDGEGGKHTANRRPVKLIYYETFERVDEAFAREKQIQKWSRAKKIALIENDTDRLKALASNRSVREQKPVPELAERAHFEGYPSDFFDFVIIDECHRGGAKDESNWRGILEHFDSATQLGLTATPLRTINADTYRYFGDPVYTYALKDGINDGFLTPFKVNQISTTIDDYVYTSDDTILEGEVVVGKAIVFCATQLHALAVRDLINQLKTSKDPNYCARVTADDGKQGELALKQFQDNEKTIPTILTTSQKLSTGVDARNVRHIVLLRPVNSMIEFKQIVGRGTRLYDGKDYFTIHDFVKAYKHFADPDWDGEPVEPVPPDTPPPSQPCPECGQRPCVCPKPPTEPCDVCGENPCACNRQRTLKIKLADGKFRNIQHMVHTSFWGPDGKPMSSEEFLQQLFGDIPGFFANEDELRALWSNPQTRRKLLDGLAEKGYAAPQLRELAKLIQAENSDIFDVLAHVAYAREPITREQRVVEHQDLIYSHYNDKQQAFLDFVLSNYVRDGIDQLEPAKLGYLLDLKYGGLHDATPELGEVSAISELFTGFQKHLFEDDEGAKEQVL